MVNNHSVKITTSDGVIKVVFEGAQRYLYDGEIQIPLGALFAVQDKSNLIVWKKIANGDVLFASKYSETTINGVQVTRENLEELFQNLVEGEIDLSDYITSTDLEQALEDYYTADEVDDMLENIDTFEIVQELPVTGKTNKIYVTPTTGETEQGNVFTEWAYINDQWEEIGKFHPEVDLSGYALKSEVQAVHDKLIEDEETTAAALTEIKTEMAEAGLKKVTLTQAQYDALETKDDKTIYIISDGGVEHDVIYLTQAAYDALETKEQDKLYVITDAVSTPVYSTDSVDALLAEKQDTLVSGENIKTINGGSILGEGDIVVGADTTEIELATAAALNDLNGSKATYKWVRENYASKTVTDDLQLQIDNSNANIQTLSGDVATNTANIETKANKSYVLETEKNTANVLCTLNERIENAGASAALEQKVLEDEETTAAALSELNDSVSSMTEDITSISAITSGLPNNVVTMDKLVGDNVYIAAALPGGGYDIPTATPNVYNKQEIDSRLDNLSFKRITQADYDALATKDPNTFYVIVSQVPVGTI